MTPKPPFHGGKIVEGQDEGVLQDLFRGAGVSRNWNPVSGFLSGRGVGDEELVDASMVVALELPDHRSLPMRPRNSDGMNGRFGTGDGESNPAVGPEDPQQMLGIRGLEFVGGSEHRRPRGPKAVPDRLHDPGMAVAEDERPERETVV